MSAAFNHVFVSGPDSAEEEKDGEPDIRRQTKNR
jgi:hypothetical protein